MPAPVLLLWPAKSGAEDGGAVLLLAGAPTCASDMSLASKAIRLLDKRLTMSQAQITSLYRIAARSTED